MATSFFDHTFAGDVFLSTNSDKEILSTNSSGKLLGTSQAEMFGFVNAYSYGAIGDFIYSYSATNPNIVTYLSGTNSTSAIQNALDAAANLLTLASNRFQGKALCYIPKGNYYITGTLNVPANVILHCDGTLFNFKSNDEALVIGANYSECRRLTIFANNKNGVFWGATSSSNSANCNISQLRVYAVGTAYNSQLTYQKCALRLFGTNISVSEIYLEGGYVGLDIYGSRIFLSKILIAKSRTGVILNSCEHLICHYIFWDSIIDIACKIDNSSDCLIHGRSSVNSNAGATPMSKGFLIGNSSSVNNANLDIEYTAQSTGGILLDISRVKDCKFKLAATNTRTTDQSNVSNSSHWVADNNGAVHNHNIGKNYQYNLGDPIETDTGVIAYGANLSGFVDIELTIDETISYLFSGTQVGTLNVILPTGFLNYINNVNKTLLKSLTINLTSVGTTDVYISPDYTYYSFTGCGSGAGSGSGMLSGTTNTAAYGGGGGAPGAIAEVSGLVSELLVSNSTTLYKFIVGAKGTGGAPVSTSNTVGNPGTSGGTTQIKRNSDGYILLSALGGSPGQGGTTSSGSAGTAVLATNSTQSTVSGAASSVSGSPSTPTTSPVAPGGGGGGGGISPTNTPYSGGNYGLGGNVVSPGNNNNSGGAASTTGNGGNGIDAPTKSIYGITGGNGAPGGGASTSGNGGQGGKGTRGGGAGGGGAARSGTNPITGMQNVSGGGNEGGAGYIVGVLWG